MGKRKGRGSRQPSQRDLAAKRRRETTRAGRAADPLCRGFERCRRCERPCPIALQLERRRMVAGDEAVGTDFPPDVLLARGLIDQQMRDEALRFAMLAWWLYPRPSPSCAAIYERMVAEGFGAGDFAPRPEGETDETRLAHIRSQKARFYRMLGALGAVARGAVETLRVGGQPITCEPPLWKGGPLWQAVRAATQFLEMPSLIRKLEGEALAADEGDYRQMALLVAGLKRLVLARDAEDRHWRERRKRAGAELSAAIQRSETFLP